MLRRLTHVKSSTHSRAGTHLGLAACALIVACGPAVQQTTATQPRAVTQAPQAVTQPSSIAVDTSFRFGRFSNHGVIIGQLGVDTRGFLIAAPNARGTTALIALYQEGSPRAYRMSFGEPEGNEHPFAIALPAGRYYFTRSGATFNAPIRVLTIRTTVMVPDATTARASFDVTPGVVTCVGRVALELELFMSMRGETSIVPRGIGVTDTCERTASAFQRRYRAVSDSVRTRLAAVPR